MTKILIIDDSESIRKLIKHALSDSEEFELIESENGLEGLDEIKKNNIDLIICDTDMPIMNGIEMVDKVRNTLFKSTPIIALATKPEKKHQESIISSGVNEILIKPFTPLKIKETVDYFLII